MSNKGASVDRARVFDQKVDAVVRPAVEYTVAPVQAVENAAFREIIKGDLVRNAAAVEIRVAVDAANKTFLFAE